MEDYKYNGGWGMHTIKVEFQTGKYKGWVTYHNGGNSNGMSLLEGVDDTLCWILKFIENTCEFKLLGDDWFSMVLSDADGNELIIEEELDDLGMYIVGVSIVDYEKEEA